MKRYTFILFLILCNFLQAQYKVLQFPVDKQLIGKSFFENFGIVQIQGEYSTNSELADSLCVVVCRNGAEIGKHYYALEKKLNQNTTLPFSFSLSIQAELAQYSFELFAIHQSKKTSIQKAENVVVGDVLLVNGQSNAESRMFEGSTAHLESPYIRVFGGSFESVKQHEENLKWFIAKADVGTGNSGAIGQWPLYLAKHLSDSLGYPIAVINGAYGGREIAYFQKKYVAINQEKNSYTRFMERIEKSGLKDFVRTICWAQGENDAYKNNNLPYYKSQFTHLKNDWKKDFPNLKHIYLFQTALGCRTSAFGYVSVAEAQRQLAEEDNAIFLIPTNGLQLHSDLCHFPFKNGYEVFGERLLSQMLHFTYESKQKRVLTTPSILTVEFKDDKTLFLTFNESLTHMNEAYSQFMLLNKKCQRSNRIEVRANTLTIFFADTIDTKSLLIYLHSNSRIGSQIRSKKNVPIATFVKKLEF